MPKTRGKKNPTPGVIEKYIRTPMMPPTQYSETEVSVLDAENDGAFQPQSVTEINEQEDDQVDGSHDWE